MILLFDYKTPYCPSRKNRLLFCYYNIKNTAIVYIITLMAVGYSVWAGWVIDSTKIAGAPYIGKLSNVPTANIIGFFFFWRKLT